MAVSRRVRVRGLAVGLLAAGAAGVPAQGTGSPPSLGHPGSNEPANLREFFGELDSRPYDLELLLSFGTSKGGSAGHLALSFKGMAGDDDLVYSANFYADRDPKHATGYYTQDLMCRIPRREYLYGTRSSLGPDASFGLDYGEVYKRALIGVRMSGFPASEVRRLVAQLDRLERDFDAQAERADYHPRPIVYDYMDLNCAKTIAVGFRYGLGWRDVGIRGEGLSGLHLVRALKANIPSSSLQEIMKAAAKRGRRMEVLLYKKFEHSTYVNPKDESGRMYKDLPNRFPSVLSTDYRMDQGRYEDYDNLYAMQLLYGLGRASVVLDAATGRLVIEREKEPSAWDEAVRVAEDKASEDSKWLLRRVLFRAWGVRLGDGTDYRDLYDGDAPPSFQGLGGPE